jgi:hypothetical protein
MLRLKSDRSDFGQPNVACSLRYNGSEYEPGAARSACETPLPRATETPLPDVRKSCPELSHVSAEISSLQEVNDSTAEELWARVCDGISMLPVGLV